MSKWWSKIIVLHYKDDKLMSSNPFRFRYKTGRNFEKILESMSHDNELVYLKHIRDYVMREMRQLYPTDFKEIAIYNKLYDVVNTCVENFNNERRYKE